MPTSFEVGLSGKVLSKMPKHFLIEDKLITCAACTGSIDSVIQPIKNNSFTYQLNVENGALVLHVSEDQAEHVKSEIRRVSQEVGFFFDDCIWREVDENGVLKENTAIDIKKENKIPHHLVRGFLSIVIGVLWIILPFLPFLAPVVFLAIILSLSIVSTLTIVYSGWEIFVRALEAAKRRHITMDTQFAVSVLIAFVISWLAVGLTGFSFLFDAALLILGFRHIGLAIDEWAKRKIDDGSSLIDGLPKIVTVILEGDGEEKSRSIQKEAKSLVRGDKIRIMPGMVIPTDGVCVSECATLVAPDFSGQPDPFAVPKGGKLLQGYKVIGNPVELIVERPIAESTLAAMQNRAKIAAEKRMDSVSATTKLGANFSKGVFIVTLLAFGFVLFYSGFLLGFSIGIGLTLALKIALGVLVASCPCTFGSIIPTIGKVGTYKCLKNGVTLLDANVLENTAKAKCIAFDLNGTLTTGVKTVHQIRFIGDEKNSGHKKILAYIKFLEEKSDHLVGQAIYSHLVSRYPDENLSEAEMAELKAVNYGMGMRVDIHGEQLIIGNRNSLPQGVTFNPQDFPVLAPMMQRNYIAYGNNVIGYIDIAEQIRPEALQVLEYFRAQGIRVVLCTGADEETAKAYGEALGFKKEDIGAGLSVKPDAKEHPKEICIKALGFKEEDIEAALSVKPDAKHPKEICINVLQEKYGPTIFVGDAGNDSLPIAAAAVGVLVDSPTMREANKTGANVYIGQRFLWPLVKMHAISKQTIFNIRLSLGFSVLYNLASFVFMGGLALFWLGIMMNPGLGVAIMVGQALFVLMFAAIFNAWPLPNRQEIGEAKITSVVHSYGSMLGSQLAITNDPEVLALAKQKDLQPISSSRDTILAGQSALKIKVSSGDRVDFSMDQNSNEGLVL